MKCFYHEDRDSKYRCKICEKPICSDCKIIAGNDIYCRDCYESLKNKNINRHYSKFWAFVFSLVPGVGHMYLGLMRQGLFFLLLIFACIAIGNISYEGILFFFLGTVVWFYSFFDAYHIRKRIDNNEDILNKHLISDKIFKLDIKKKYIAVGIIVLGVYLLFNELLLTTNSFIEISYYQRRAFSRLALPVILIIGGLLLLSRIKKTAMNNEQEIDDNRTGENNVNYNEKTYQTINSSYIDDEVNKEDVILENEIDINYDDETDNIVN